jgi:hypothetical protein
MSLEYNKYDHIHLRCEYMPALLEKKVPDLIAKLSVYHTTIKGIQHFSVQTIQDKTHLFPYRLYHVLQGTGLDLQRS